MRDESLLLGKLADEYTTRLRDGSRPDVEEYARQHPALAERIRELFPTLLLLEGLAGGNTQTVEMDVGRAVGQELASGGLFGNYRIERELGRGGMGIVYEAVHVPLDKRLALKVLPGRGGRESPHVERFVREAKTAAALHHTNIVPVFDVGEAGGVTYYAMQYIDGRGLDRVLRDLESNKRSLPSGLVPEPSSVEFCRWAAELGVHAAEGLAHAHERGVIHRDIKPSNLLLDGQGVLWITDFGLARRLDDPAMTQSGALLGTPRYMSPEQARAARKPIDHRTDIYSLGATLYELITRRPAFDGATPQDVVIQILDREPVAPRRLNPALPRDLETIVAKAMAKRPEDRYATASDLADDLRRWLRTEPIRARRIGPLGRMARWCRRNPLVASLTLTVAALLVVAALVAARVAVGFRDLAERERESGDAARKSQSEADQQRRAAVVAQEETKDHLARSLFQQARAEAASTRFARRQTSLDLLNQSRELTLRPRLPNVPRPLGLPTRAEMRGLGADLLLAPEARLTASIEHNAGFQPAVNREGTRAFVPFLDAATKERGVWVMDLATGKELARWTGNEAANAGRLELSADGRLVLGIVSTASPRAAELVQLCAWESADGIAADRVYAWPTDKDSARVMPRSTTDLIAAGAAAVGSYYATRIGLPGAVVSRVIVSPSGKHLVGVKTTSAPGTAGAAGTTGVEIVVWNVASGEGHIVARDTKSPGAWVAISDDGRRLAFPRGDRLVVWDLEQGRQNAEFVPPLPLCGQIAFGPHADVLLLPCAGADDGPRGVVVAWDLAENREQNRLHLDSAVVPQAVAYHAGGDRLAISESKGDVVVLDYGSRRESYRLAAAHDMPVTLLRWDASGHGLTTGAIDGTLRHWRLEQSTGRSSTALPARRVSHLAFSSDGRWLAAGHPLESATLIVERDTGRVVHRLSDTGELMFCRDGRQLAVLQAASSQAALWDLETEEQVSFVWANHAQREALTSAAFDGRGHLLTARLAEARLEIWDSTAGASLWRLPANASAFTGVLSSDGRRLATCDQGLNDFTLWAPPAQEPLGQVKLDGGLAAVVARFSPDGRWLVGSCMRLGVHAEGQQGRPANPTGEAGIFVWDVATRQIRLRVPVAQSLPSFAVSPDGRQLALATRGGTMQLWDIERGEQIFDWQVGGMVSSVPSLDFTPDGQQIAWCDGESGTVEFLDLGVLRQRLAEIGLGW